jgi:hypothetical protein
MTTLDYINEFSKKRINQLEWDEEIFENQNYNVSHQNKIEPDFNVMYTNEIKEYELTKKKDEPFYIEIANLEIDIIDTIS